MVVFLSFGLRSLQQSVLNRGSLKSGIQSSSYLPKDSNTFAAMAAQGVPLSPTGIETGSPGGSGGSRVSFDLSEHPDDNSPRRSTQLSLPTSIWGAMRHTIYDRERDIIIDLKNVEMGELGRESDLTKTKLRIVQAIRSIEGLANIDLKGFRVRHTNQDVHLAYFKVPKKVANLIRDNSSRWIKTSLKGARLVEPSWYSVKGDFIDKVAAMDPVTGKVGDNAHQAFGKENEVEVKQMRWLGRPKEHAAYASAVVKLACKAQAEKLLLNSEEGTVLLFGCAVQVQPLEERKGPKACFRCQQYGHLKRDCRNNPKCSICAKDGHEWYNSTVVRCANCNREHKSSDQRMESEVMRLR